MTGHNFRLTNVAAAILCAQLERRDQILERRGQIFGLYRKLLEGIPGVGFQPVAAWAEPAPWLFCITVDASEFGMTRDELIHVLTERGIDSRPFFIPLHTLPPFREASFSRGEYLPITDHLGRVGLNLPTFPGLSDPEMHRIGDEIRHAHRVKATAVSPN